MEYEKTPTHAIKGRDGKVTYLFKSLTDPNRSIAVVDDEKLNWTEHLQKMLDSGLLDNK